jgi:hypothetical protein
MAFGRPICLLASCLAVMVPALAGQEFTPLAARYREARGDGHAPPRSVEWYFTRNGNQVEIGRGPYVELWERDNHGEVSWLRIFHEDRKLISYPQGELRTQGRALPWETLNTIFDPKALLGKLHRVEETNFLGHPAVRYQGKVGNREIEVVWLEAEQVPGRIVHRDQMHTYYQLALEELRSEPASDWPRSDIARTDSYELLSGADLGDREYDPFVQKVFAMDGHSHAH